MVRRSKTSCHACLKKKVKCDKLQPRCSVCQKEGDHCQYKFELRWGGRPYKNKDKIINIPANTILVDGILVAKRRIMTVDKTVAANNPKSKSNTKELVLINEALQFNSKIVSTSQKESRITKIEKNALASNKANSSISSKACMEHMYKKTSHSNHAIISCLSVNNRSLDLISSQEISCDRVKLYELFSFYIHETSQLFIVSNNHEISNPFGIIIPQMAMSSPTLMKLLMVFAAKHQKKLGYTRDINDFLSLEEMFVPETNSNELIKQLCDKSMSELHRKLTNYSERFSNFTLACVLVLAAIDIFFDEKQSKWKAHLYGARGIIVGKLRRFSGIKERKVFYRVEEDQNSFLIRWFMYLNVISLLSSPELSSQAEIFQHLDFKFSPSNHEEREKLQDIQYTSGVEPLVLSYLAHVSKLIFEKSKVSSPCQQQRLAVQAIELDFELLRYLDQSEKERDEVMVSKIRNAAILPKSQIHLYQLLRATNLIFGLTGVLLLRRRVLGLPSESRMIKDILIQVSSLLRKKVPLYSPAQSCILLCIFCCGCELIDESLESLRRLYLNHLNSLQKSGISGAYLARTVMQECWITKKPWWEISKSRNLDLCFAI